MGIQNGTQLLKSKLNHAKTDCRATRASQICVLLQDHPQDKSNLSFYRLLHRYRTASLSACKAVSLGLELGLELGF